MWKRYLDSGSPLQNYQNCSRPSHKEELDSKIETAIKENRRITSREIKEKIKEEEKEEIAERTIRKIRKCLDFKHLPVI